MKQVLIGKKFESLKNVEIVKNSAEISKDSAEMSEEDYNFERACETIFHM